MKTLKFLLGGFLLIAFFFACKKEKSFESGHGGSTSHGSLQGAGGACLGITVHGNYKKDSTLDTSNYVIVTINVTTPGTYNFGTDTANGIYFHGSGSFSAAGVNAVKLNGTGKPLAAGTNTFTVKYDSTQCTFAITTTGSGGGPGSAVFTLSGSPTTCVNASFQGTYTAGVSTNASNTMAVEVNVTTIGTYSITATGDGLTFTASGSFTATGVQNVILVSTGSAPANSGTQPITVTTGSSSCTKNLTVGSSTGPAVFTANCAGITSAGTYYQGSPIYNNPTITIPVTVTTAGTYSVTTTANGMTFTGSGSLAAGGGTIVLTGTGIPNNPGNTTFSITAGSTTCSYIINVNPMDYYPRTTNSNWSYNIYDSVGTLVDTLFRTVISNTLNAFGNTYNIFMETVDVSQGYDSSGYFRRNGGNYYEYFDVGGFLGADNPVWGEYIFLKDNVAANSPSWVSPSFPCSFNGTNVNVRLKDSVVQKDVPITVQGVTYQNVIVVREDYQYFNGSSWVSLFSGNAYGMGYFARNLGLIKLEFLKTTGLPTIYKQEVTRTQVY